MKQKINYDVDLINIWNNDKSFILDRIPDKIKKEIVDEFMEGRED